ncbi:hypothetical protein BFW38_05675 [Terasakiispira papahanaumokuakeensis]|uniref:Uncharacterized protein n=1 Tax=Terasakiispira papahanaumokuakeensis TaxID=197479 RepID=A0A1E2V7X0_9GAMM|nr:hypothetical protein [Terasakiispira papahanaumokuakeensis]ODC03109.1 hypothetical protein BFW38_05675 [Terasakiispira papahanaumokuakeensis]
MLAQPTPSQPEEEEETLSTAEQLKQKAGQYNQRATDLREQLNNNPNGKSHEEALALQDEVTRLNADTQQLQEDLNEAARAGDLTDALYDVDDAANRANNLRPEAARQVQYASHNGQQAQAVAELVVPGLGTLTDAKNIAQLLSTGQYGAAAGMTGLAIASIFPPFRAARKVGRTSDAAEDVASASKQLGRSAARRVPGRVQSRINVSNEGWEHTLNRHFNSSRAQNKSQFTISEDELKGLLSSKEIIQSPARSLETGNYARTIEMDEPIGRLAQKWGGRKNK